MTVSAALEKRSTSPDELDYVSILYLNWHNTGQLPANYYDMDVQTVLTLFALQRAVSFLAEDEESEAEND